MRFCVLHNTGPAWCPPKNLINGSYNGKVQGHLEGTEWGGSEEVSLHHLRREGTGVPFLKAEWGEFSTQELLHKHSSIWLETCNSPPDAPVLLALWHGVSWLPKCCLEIWSTKSTMNFESSLTAHYALQKRSIIFSLEAGLITKIKYLNPLNENWKYNKTGPTVKNIWDK